ncbi:DUF4007 family protein [Hymenobacter elongatus]|uniref:DUF4007 family protein n=1 Tax=Hymenobacter elongatus TaxID=877208 RepID=A0A4Z0PJ65_9BACT|nr:DUF4007 family protein [Hymenobacter elongatus]TGE15016.1 DUF4007 family protein [Hymenobacter elongatus]
MRFRFSGHESFPCRYTWLPKAYRTIHSTPLLFADDNHAMVQLGVGKNMVKAIRFWVQAFGVAEQRPEQQGLFITSFGNAIFNPQGGQDPFLEDIRTLWLLHWKVSTIVDAPLFAWHFLLNRWQNAEFSRTEVIEAFGVESDRMERSLSDFTKQQHFDIFLHTYLPVRARKGNDILEENLDCPLTELHLVIPAGERAMEEAGKREQLYAFRQDAKTDVTGPLVAYCLFDFWRSYRREEKSLSFRDIYALPGSVGQVFKLTELDLQSRLVELSKDSQQFFEYRDSAALPRLVKTGELNEQAEALLLSGIYGRPATAYFEAQPIEELPVQNLTGGEEVHHA